MRQVLWVCVLTVLALMPATPSHADDVVRIATFNIRVFGQTKMGRPDVVQTLADIVRKYDLVAVQEIKDVSEQVADDFLAELGTGWDMVESPRTGRNPDDTSSREQYVYYFRTDTISALDDGVLFDDTNDQFQREPWLARFQVMDGNFTFVLINIHTKPDRAVEEVAALDDVIEWAQSRPAWATEDDFIALGDFNASCNYASNNELDALDLSGSDYFWIVPHTADTNLASSQCAYDRIVATVGVEEDYAGFWDVDRAFTLGSVSDHWPVWAAFYTGRDG